MTEWRLVYDLSLQHYRLVLGLWASIDPAWGRVGGVPEFSPARASPARSTAVATSRVRARNSARGLDASDRGESL
jgi:hypothetical protein